LLHPHIQGNKWRKLAPVLKMLQQSDYSGIVTFGGPFSNHLQAVAAAGRLYGIPTVGIVRGKYADPDNPTLQAARSDGMLLLPVSKVEYDAFKDHGAKWIERHFPRHYILPEGGATAAAVENCAAIPREIVAQLQQYQVPADAPLYICTPAGTGSTSAGIVEGFTACKGQVLVFPVVSRGFDAPAILQLLDAVRKRSQDETAALERRFDIVRDYEFGGFAKKHPPVIDFLRVFREQTGILLDPVYTAKMMYGIDDMLALGFFPPGSTVVALHTGGLQGWEGFRQRYGG
jgi:1-aminocyclopropane-1-carboxylate deaminase/D-cysteine desulfhydrase-like pyridoxal-dependent ACC family enzyme